MKHHEFSPSSLTRINLCPASYHATRNKQSVSSVHSERGTELHKAVEARDSSVIKSEKDKEAVDRCIAVCNQFKDLESHTECKIAVYDFDGTTITEGTVDQCFVDNNRKLVILIDWKFGFNPVESDSLQMMAYAVGLMQKYNYDVVSYIFQPALNPLCELINPSHFKIDDMPIYINKITKIIDTAKVEKYNYKPSIDACRFCSNLNCIVLADLENEVISTAIQPEELSDLMDKLKIVLLKKDKLEKALKDGIANSEKGTLGNYYLQSSSKRSVDPSDFSDILGSDKLLSSASISLEKLELLLMEAVDGATPKEVKAKVTALINERATLTPVSTLKRM